MQKDKQAPRSLSPWLEKNKALAMWSLVVVLALAIFTLWALNLKNIWQKGNSDEAINIETVREEIDSSINDLKDQLKQEEDNRLLEDSDKLIKDLIEESEKKASSSEDLVLPPVNSNCPAWINCMPTIGEARPCQIPVGCEGITQIAY